jgi:predicted RNA binding protein YcfA (HicA-like mRNA interferase family)
MPKLGIFSGKEVCGILEKQGFTLVRQRGSHMIMQKRTADSTITVPVPAHNPVKIGTLGSIIRMSGVDRNLFVK